MDDSQVQKGKRVVAATKNQRLDKMLGHVGYGTRKDIKSIVRAGRVSVNGQVASDSGMHVELESAVVVVDDKPVLYREHVYLMLNKPNGVVSATEDARDRTVIDLLDAQWQHFKLFPVGRLDKDTEGLLILTDDGKLAHRLLSPKHHVAKSYFACIDGRVTDSDVGAFQRGLTLSDGYKTLPAELSILVAADVSQVEVTVYEGKFHQVKRMFEAVGKTVVYLKRIRMGSLELDTSLELGAYREVLQHELAQLSQPPTS